MSPTPNPAADPEATPSDVQSAPMPSVKKTSAVTTSAKPSDDSINPAPARAGVLPQPSPSRAAASGPSATGVLAPDPLVVAAEGLIVRGKEAGYLTPDDVLAAFPEIDVEPDHLERIFHAFREMGIEVTDGDKDFEVVEDDEELVATAVRELLAAYEQKRDLILLGAYKSGSDPRIDRAIAKNEAVATFLRQGLHEAAKFEETRKRLLALL